jgi:GT2 family glycosyltransferase
MRVSAVIPTFNRIGYIDRAIHSVLAQTVPVDEVVVVDEKFGVRITEVVSKSRRLASVA